MSDEHEAYGAMVYRGLAEQRQADGHRTEDGANVADLSRIYAKLHETRFEHVTRARRERELETRVYQLERLLREAGDFLNSGRAREADIATRISAALEQP